jgi:hypothetical protein
MQPAALPSTAYALTALNPIALFPFIEASRNRRHVTLAFPVIMGLLYQNFTIAVIMPLFCLAFVVSGAATLHKRPAGPHTMIDHGQAEGLAFGLVIGFIIPTASMLVLQDPIVTAIWQAIPLWFSIAHFAHRVVRPNKESGYKTIQVTYIICFIITSSTHFSIIWPRLGDWATLKELLAPSLSPLDPITTSIIQGTVDFLKWDAIIASTTVILTSFWFPKTITQTAGFFVWYIISIPLVGPGASIAGVLLWREALLNDQRLAVLTEKKAS